MFPSSDLIHRNAIALSHIGVTLMKQRKYIYALETMSDALVLAKACVQDPTSTTDILSSILMECANMHHRALQRLNQTPVPPEDSRESSTGTRSNTEYTSPPPLESTFHATDVCCSQNIHLDEKLESIITNERTLCFIHTDITDYYSVSPVSMYSIILNNMAVAFVMLCTPSSCWYTAKAIKLLQLSYAIQSKLLHTDEGDPHNVRIIRIILNNLTTVLDCAGHEEKAKSFCPTLLSLQELEEQMSIVYFFAGSNSVAAAQA